MTGTLVVFYIGALLSWVSVSMVAGLKSDIPERYPFTVFTLLVVCWLLSPITLPLAALCGLVYVARAIYREVRQIQQEQQPEIAAAMRDVEEWLRANPSENRGPET